MLQRPTVHHHYHGCAIMSSSLFFSFFPQTLTLTPRPRFVCSSVERPIASSRPEFVSKTTIQRIVEKLRNLGFVEKGEEKSENGDDEPGPGSPGEIFIPSPDAIPDPRVGHTLDSSWSHMDQPIPEPGSGEAFDGFRSGCVPRERRRQLAPTVAELTIPSAELKRLRAVGIRLDRRLKVGRPGVTEGIVNGIHERWRRSEVVKIKCEDLCRVNMKRTHEILERKTGGLVIWRSGSTILLYRGTNYAYPYFTADTIEKADERALDREMEPTTSAASEPTCETGGSSYEMGGKEQVEKGTPIRLAGSSLVKGVGSPQRVRFQLAGELEVVEVSDRLLEGLGLRFSDWWGEDPLPVDADLLPGVVPGYRKPFRLLPYGIKPKLTDREMTILRRLSRPVPCHFALGRNRNLQGLASSIVKLWEKCEITKVAIKRGVQNTNSELMAEEIKLLTGGTLLSRDREFIVFYRGKDFLPLAVSNAIEERRKHDMYMVPKKQEIFSGEETENKSGKLYVPNAGVVSRAAAVKESGEADNKPTNQRRRSSFGSVAIRRVDGINLSLALEKKKAVEKELAKLEGNIKVAEPTLDREAITQEEQYMLRKLGLRMKAFLLLGRRGVFDGTIENMHLHWKHRELVKIISNDRDFTEAHRTASMLEAESGGILVAVERVSKGYAIIVYRGKNYRRPDNLRPQTLLNKKQAMQRSIEEQRYRSLKLRVLRLGNDIQRIKDQTVEEKRDALSSLSVTDEHEVHINGEPDSFPDRTDEIEIVGDVADDDMSTIPRLEDGGDVSEAPPTGIMDSKFTVANGDEQISENPAFDNIRGPLRSRRRQRQPWLLNDHSKSTHPRESENDFDSVNSFRASPLSNKERLILRRQALLMKKHPVLAIGRNNIITGVVKAILTHFKKKPLAIVNVKGRAKGTSVRELVFKLEQATGSALVSQEPNKVILYRGWGADEQGPGSQSVKPRTHQKLPGGSDSLNGDALSVDLTTAIRLECGLQETHFVEGTCD